MKLVKTSIEYLDSSKGIKLIEQAGRTCYKSEPKITEDSAQAFVKRLIKSGHDAMLEFGWLCYRVICDRGMSHCLVRHRLFSFAQESTQYCKYKNDLTFIEPCWINENDINKKRWLTHLKKSEQCYLDMLKDGWTPQQARSVLPNSLKTELCIAGNLREWRHFFKLRTSKYAQRQIRELANLLLIDAKTRFEILFDKDI